ncbi:MAG: DUF7507 domain-containing protein, partial [Prolixibacteraceae bacterium]
MKLTIIENVLSGTATGKPLQFFSAKHIFSLVFILLVNQLFAAGELTVPLYSPDVPDNKPQLLTGKRFYVDNPGMTLTKRGTFNDENNDGNADPEETISYVFILENTGNVALTDVKVNDPLITVSGEPITLERWETDSTTFAGSYSILQDDINAGQVENTATATSNESDPVTDYVVTQLVQDAGLTFIKSGVFNDANNDGNADPGETISYSFTLENTGNVTLTNVTVTDPMVTVDGGPVDLDPGVSDNSTFSATYEITQDDIDAGVVDNTATADSDQTDPVTSGESVTLIRESSMTVEKSSTTTEITEAGQTVTYNYLVTNTGDVTLT